MIWVAATAAAAPTLSTFIRMPALRDLQQHPQGRARAAADLLHRSFAGPIANVLAIVIFLFGTRLPVEHPIATTLYLGMLAIRQIGRLVITRLIGRKQHARPVQVPLGLIRISAYTLSAPTGLFASFIVRQYGFDSWNTLFIFIFAMACAVSGTTAIAPDLRTAIGFQLSLLLPIAFVTLSMGGDQGYSASAATVAITGYAVVQTIRQNADYWNSVAADVALRKRAEELEVARMAADEANRAKSQFLANMSHEIRTPMNGVLGMLDLVLRTDLSSEQRQHLGYARESAHSLLGLLNDILDHSKAEAGKLELEMTDFAIRSTVEEAVRPFLSQAATKGITLDTSIESDVARFFKGDPVRLRQVITNLVSNALKFTERGTVRILVSMESPARERPVLHFAVADTGLGIPREKQQSIFEAFSQADGSITRRFGGTGLGLAICSDLVRLMGGRIWVESEPGLGSTFHFTAAFESSSGRVTVEECDETAPVACTPLRVLIAEDNVINQKVLTRVLSLGGHSYEVAANGEEAFAHYRTGGFDLILMDVQMPGTDGLEATRQIRSAESTSGDRLPIIGVTAGASASEVAACLAAGMDSCITKPIVIREVEQLLAGIADRKAAKPEVRC